MTNYAVAQARVMLAWEQDATERERLLVMRRLEAFHPRKCVVDFWETGVALSLERGDGQTKAEARVLAVLSGVLAREIEKLDSQPQ